MGRMCFSDYRDFLPLGDPLRTDPRFGLPTYRVCEIKTDDDYFMWSDVAAAGRHSKQFDPNSTSGGFHGRNQFCRLRYWRPVTNAVLDLSHITKGVLKHAIEMMKGQRVPKSAYKRRRGNTGKSVDVAEVNQDLLRETLDRITRFHVDDTAQARSDELYNSIRGPPDMRLASRTMWGRTSTLRMSDWSTVAQHTGKYLMSVTCTHTRLWQRLLDVLEFYHRRQFSDAELAKMKVETLRVLCEYQLEMPATEFAIVHHLLVHCADTAAYWGSLTEFWM
jgi:hypothetical protein